MKSLFKNFNQSIFDIPPNFHNRILFLAAVFLALLIMLGYRSTRYVGDLARQEIVHGNNTMAYAASQYLNDQLHEVENTALILSGAAPIISALKSKTAETIEDAHGVLDLFSKNLETSICYVMDNTGKVIASSNRFEKNSFLGESYGFRPYFQEAQKGDMGEYFALGVTSGRRGFYAAVPVRDDKGQILGVAVIKKNVSNIEDYLSNWPYFYFISPEGIIFLSSNHEALFRPLWPINEKVRKRLLETKQFGKQIFKPVFNKKIFDGAEVKLQGRRFYISRKLVGTRGWSVVFLQLTERIWLYKFIVIIVTIFLCILFGEFFYVIYSTNKSAQMFKESEERFKQVALSSKDWIWEIDNKKKYVYSSQAVKDIIGYEPNEVIGTSYEEYFPPERKDYLIREARKLLTSKEGSFHVFSEVLHKNGKNVLLETNGVLMLDEKDHVKGFRGVSRDITERKMAEEDLKTKNILLQEREQELQKSQQELQNKVSDLERFHNLAVGRELRIIELKEKLKEYEEGKRKNNTRHKTHGD